MGADDAVEVTRLLARQTGTAFVAVTKAGYHLLAAKPEVVAQALAKLPERQRRLDLAQLHSLVLEQLLGITRRRFLSSGICAICAMPGKQSTRFREGKRTWPS